MLRFAPVAGGTAPPGSAPTSPTRSRISPLRRGSARRIWSAYKLDTSEGTGRTIAIVDAYDYPNAEANSRTYRASTACRPARPRTAASRSSTRTAGVAAARRPTSGLDRRDGARPRHGQRGLPELQDRARPSAELTSAWGSRRGQDTAASLGANVVSNSWGGPSDGNDVSYESAYFTHTGVDDVRGAGDTSYGAPSTRHLGRRDRGRWHDPGQVLQRTRLDRERVVHQQPRQLVLQATSRSRLPDRHRLRQARRSGHRGRWRSQHRRRGLRHVRARAAGRSYGGTSVASPLSAAIFAVTGTRRDDPSFVYAHTSKFYDVTSGKNATSCSPSYLCTAGAGYDGPTGWGTPNGAGARRRWRGRRWRWRGRRWLRGRRWRWRGRRRRWRGRRWRWRGRRWRRRGRRRRWRGRRWRRRRNLLAQRMHDRHGAREGLRHVRRRDLRGRLVLLHHGVGQHLRRRDQLGLRRDLRRWRRWRRWWRWRRRRWCRRRRWWHRRHLRAQRLLERQERSRTAATRA